MYKAVLFTHDDLDGAGCRIIFEVAHRKWKKGEDYKVFNCSNGTVDDYVNAFICGESVQEFVKDYPNEPKPIIVFADISASRECLEWLQNTLGYEVFVFDHHRTNFFVEHILDDNHRRILPESSLGKLASGTSILYKYYCELEFANINNPDSVYHGFTQDANTDLFAPFVDAVRSWDVFEWKETGDMVPKRLQILFTLLGMERFCDMYVARLSGDLNDTLIDSNADMFIDAKIENEQRIIDNFTIDDTVITSVRGLHTALIMKATGANISELSSQFLAKNPDLDIVAYVSLFNGGEFGFRTVKDDISTCDVVASPIGGGGHPKASGARFDDELRADLANIMIHYLNGYHISHLDFEENPNYIKGE